MQCEPAPLGLFECKGKGVEALARAEPNVPAGAQIDRRAEVGGVFAAHDAVRAVGDHQHVGVADRFVVADLAAEAKVDAQFERARLEDGEQTHAPEAGKALTPRAKPPAPEVDVDRVPVHEGRLDRAVSGGIGGGDVAQGLIREDDAPTEGVVGAVALVDDDLGAGHRPLEQDREEEAGRTSSDAGDAHAEFPLASGTSSGYLLYQ